MAAEGGVVGAMLKLGRYFENGKVVTQDLSKAFEGGICRKCGCNV